MRVLMLGGTGAMGSNLCKLLLNKEGFEIIITSRTVRHNINNIRYLYGDAHNREFLTNILLKTKYDVIIDFMQYEYDSFCERIKEVLPQTSQYIFFSSARVYANSVELITEDSPRLLDVSNDMEFVNSSEYAILKAKEENALANCNYQNWTIIRPYITYSNNRLQLGIFEKEDWLYRALKGRAILFPKELVDKTTTLTSGVDVAAILFRLIGSKEALGKTYQIVSNKIVKWGKILNVYIDTIEKITGRKIRIVTDFDPIKVSYIMGNKYQLVYDRMYDRMFNSQNVLKYSNEEYDFIEASDGLRDCLISFMDNDRQFGHISGKMEAVYDIISNEKTPLNEIPGISEKIKYIITRYSPYIRVKYGFKLK